MSGGTFERLFAAWTIAEADLYEAMDQMPPTPSLAWDEMVKAMKVLADQRYADLFGARHPAAFGSAPSSGDMGPLTTELGG